MLSLGRRTPGVGFNNILSIFAAIRYGGDAVHYCSDVQLLEF